MRKSLLSLLAVMLLAVLPAFSAPKYNLEPEGFENGAIPSGWTQENVQGTVQWTVEGGAGVKLVTPNGAKSGNYRAVIKGSTGQVEGFVTKLITPAMNLTQAYNPLLEFSHAQMARFGYFDTLRVYYRVNATAQWQSLAEYTSAISVWTSEVIALPGYQQGTQYQIAFEVSDHSGLGVVLDDVCVHPTAQCQNASIQNIAPASNSAVISVICNGSYNNFEVFVSESMISDWSEFNPETDAPFYIVTDDYEVEATGLNDYTDYYAYVRTDCEENETGYTDWVYTTFKTTRKVSLPFEETFEIYEPIAGNTSFGAPYGWRIGGMKSAIVPIIYKGSDASNKAKYSVDSTCFLAFMGNATAEPIAKDSAVFAATPEIDGDLSACEVDFWGTVGPYYNTGAKQYAAELTVGVMTNPTDLGTFQAIETVKCDYAYQFKHFRVSLAGYTGTGKHVALVSMASADNLFFVDNFSVRTIASPAPTNLRATNVLPTGFTVTPQLNGADTWNLKISETYVRDAAQLTDEQCLVNQTGLTAAQYQVQLAEALIAGKTVVVYAQGVKNGVASEWSFPLTIRVPLSGVLPINLTFNAEAIQTIAIKPLGNEIHENTNALGVKELVSPLKAYNLYPTTSGSSPAFEGAYLTLNGVDNYVVLPYVADLSNLELVFRLSAGSASNEGNSRVAVGVMTDPYDLSTFTELGRFDGPTDRFNKIRVDLSTYTGTGKFVAIRAIAPANAHDTYGSRNSIDNLILQPISTCLDASNPRVNSAVRSAVIKWDTNGMTAFKVKVFSDAQHTDLITAIDKTTAATATEDSVTVVDLLPATKYYYSIQTVCGQDTLPLEDVYSFYTKFGVPFMERFENINLGVPAGWDNTKGTAGSSYAFQLYEYDGNPGKSLRFDSYNCSSGLDNYLATPTIKLEDVEACCLTFDYKNPAGGNFEVLYALDGDTNLVQIFDNLVNQSEFITKTYDLTPFIGHDIVIYFHATSNWGPSGAYVYLDNVGVKLVDPNCMGMSRLSVDHLGETEADIVWAVGGVQEAYIKVTDAETDAVVYDGVTTTSPLKITGLTANTRYNVIGYQPCALDTNTTQFKTLCGQIAMEQFGTEKFNTSAALDCWLVGIGDTAGVGNTYLTMPGIVSKTGLGRVLKMEKPKNSEGYGYIYGNDYYAILPNIAMDSVSKYQIVFSASTDKTDDTINVHQLEIGVVTDPNDPATFVTVDMINLKYAADSAHMKNYVVGFDNYMGDLYGDYGTYIVFRVSADGAHSNVAYIDNVRLEPVDGCHQVIDLEQTGATSSSATVSWTGDAQSYDLMLTNALVLPDTVTKPLLKQEGITGNTYTFPHLNAGSTYYVYIRANCAPGESSKWSSFTQVTTTYGIPFLETFDGFTQPYLSGDWKTFAVTVPVDSVFSTDGFAVSSSSYKMSIQSVDSRISNMSGFAARTEVYSSSYNGFLQSPAIDLSGVPAGQGIHVSFRLAMVPYSASGSLTTLSGRQFIVYVSDDGGATFKAANKVEWNCDGTGDYDYAELGTAVAQLLSVDLTAFAGKNIALGFYSASTKTSPDAYLYIDSVAVAEYDNSCLQVSKVMVHPTAGGAIATWKNNSPNTAVVYELSDMPDFSHIIARDTLVADSATFSGLAYGSTYYFRIKAGCQEDWATTRFSTMYGVPYTEDFNAYTSFPTQEWTSYKGNILTGTATEALDNWTFTTYSANLIETPHIYGYTYTTTNSETNDKTITEIALASPLIYFVNAPGYEIDLSFELANGSGSSCEAAPAAADYVGHTFGVAVSTDGANTWTPVKVWNDSALMEISNYAQTLHADLSAYAGQSGQFAFFATSDSASTSESVYHVIDNVRLRHINSACEAPVAEFTSNTLNSVTLEWLAEEGMQYVVELSATPTFNEVLTSATVTGSEYTITDLNPGSLLYARVKLICSAGCESGWSETVKVRTRCEAFTDYPWSENFELRAVGTFDDACWVNEHISGGGIKLFEVSNANTTGNTTNKLVLPDMSRGTMTMLALPTMSFSDDNIYELQFSLYRNAEGTSSLAEGIRVYLADGAFIDESAQEIVFMPRNCTVEQDNLPAEGSSGWYNYSINFRASGEKTLVLVGESQYGSATYVDNLVINEISASHTLKTLTVSGANRTSLHAYWTTVDDFVCHNAEIVVSTTELDSAALEAAEKITVTNALDAVIDNLDRETTYYIYVRTVCNDEKGDWISAAGTTIGLNADTNAQLGNGVASANLVYTGWGNSYSQHIYTAQELLAAGITAGPIQAVKFNYTALSSSYDKTQTVYIGTTNNTSFDGYEPSDFNTNLTIVNGPTLRSLQPGWVTYEFNEPFIWDGESNIVIGMLTNGNGSHTSSGGWSTAGTNVGEYRTICVYKDGAQIDPDDLPFSIYGVKDMIRPNAIFAQKYSLDACPTAQNVQAALVGFGIYDAIVTWEPSTGDYVADYDVYLGTELVEDEDALAALEPQYTAIDSLSLKLSDLTPETTYYAYVRTNCDAQGHDDGSSVWSVVSFTTNSTCMPAKDLQVRFTSPTSAVATWTTYIPEQDKNFYYVFSETELDSLELENATLSEDTTMRLELNDLQVETTYYLYVQCNCTELVSKWSSLSFTTPASCQAVQNLVADRLSPSAARIAWTHAPFAFEESWEVGLVGVAGSQQIVADTMAVFANLASSTNYTAYVRALCAEGDTSEISTVSFTTKTAATTECIETAEAGSNTTSYHVPFCNYYGNSYTQMIYPASMIGQEGTINRLSFYAGLVPSVPYVQQSVTIYLANTSKAGVASTTDWVAKDSLVQVFHADNYAHPTQVGWSEIIFDNEFDYDGRNLAVIVSVINSGYSSNLKYEYTYVDMSCLSRYADYDASYAEHPGTAIGSVSGTLPVAQFCFLTGGCQKVTDLKATEITTTSATLSWFPGANETSWTTVLSQTPLTDAQILAAEKDTVSSAVQNLTNLGVGKDYFYYVAANCQSGYSKWNSVHFITEATCKIPANLMVENLTGSTADVHFGYSESGPAGAYKLAYGLDDEFNLYDPTTYQVIDLTDTVAQLTNLYPNTYYKVVVKGICSDTDESRWSEPVTFLTDCGLTTHFPWYENFDRYAVEQAFTAQCWTNKHTAGPSTNRFKVMSHSSISGGASTMLSLSYASAGNKVLLSLPAMNFAEEQPLEFSIDFYRSRYYNLLPNEGINIYISSSDTIDETAQLVAFIPRDYRLDGINVSAEDEAMWATYKFAMPSIGEGHILIEGVCQAGDAMYFDNLALTALDVNCGGINGFQISDITTNSAVVSWNTIGNNQVRVVVTDEEGKEVFNRMTTEKAVTITNLIAGKNYRARVTQICSNRSIANSFVTLYTVPLFENATRPANWSVSATPSSSYYYWRTTYSSDYVHGEMSDTVFYMYLYAGMWTEYDIDSRLMSPIIRLPELADEDETIQLDWLMGATCGYDASTAMDPGSIVRVDICTFNEEGAGTWQAVKTWEEGNLAQIPWEGSGRFNLDLSEYAGQDIRLGFYAGVFGGSDASNLVIDDIYLHAVRNFHYEASTCSSVDYQDEYFVIPTTDFVVGETTDFEKMVSGVAGAPDTLVVLSLTVTPSANVVINDTICEGQLYDRNGITPFIAKASTVKPIFYTAANGCDSLVTVNIEVIPSQRRDTTIYACKGSVVEVNGKQYYNSTVVIDTLSGINTCDSIVRTFIEFSDAGNVTIDQHRILCAGETYTDAAFPDGITAAGDYTATVTTVYGCDSTVTIHMIVANEGAAYDTVHISELPYVYAEDTIMGTNVVPGDYPFPLQATCGQVTLYLHVTDAPESGLDNIEALQLAIAPNPATVGEPINIRTTVSFTPDFRIMVFDAVGKLVYSSTEQSLTIPGMPAAGYYTIRLTADGRQYQAKLLVK